jgi:hypothetical protein
MPPLRGRLPVVCLLGLLLAHHCAAGNAQMTGAPRTAAAGSAARIVARDATNATGAARDSDATGVSGFITLCQSFLTGGGADARSAMTREAAYAPARFAKQKMVSPTRAVAELLRNRSDTLRPFNDDRPFLGCDVRLLGAAPALPWPFDSLGGGGGSVEDGVLGISYHGGDVMTTAVTKVYLIWYGSWAGHPARAVLPHCVEHASGERTAALRARRALHASC